MGKKTKRHEKYDAIVVGAGVAGLAAAYTLRGAQQRVLILEARGQVGGRVLTHPKLTGIDLGAAYFGPLQTYTMRFTELLDIPRISNELHPEFYHRTEWSDGRVFAFDRVSFAVPKDPGKTLVASLGLLAGFWDALPMQEGGEDDLKRSIALLETHVLRLRSNLETPWDDLFAEPFDSISVEDWVTNPDNVANPQVADLLRIGVRSALSAEPAEISMLYLLYYCATGGSFVNVMAVGGGADSYRFAKGAIALPKGLEKAVTRDDHGGPRARLLLDHRVTRIKQTDEGVRVFVGKGKDKKEFEAPRCIIASSPTARTKFGIDDLPSEHVALAEAMAMGRTIKAFVIFERPWWRIERGASGYALSALHTQAAPVVWTMDNTWTDKHGRPVHALMAFIVGSVADALAKLTPEERQASVLKHWAQIFRVDPKTIEDANPQYHEQVWGHGTWSGGGPAAFFKPGMFRAHAPTLRKPFGRIHWAGAETGTDWVGGYMNGALQSGMRAAWELVALANR